jgi:hypothetical protein
MHVSTDAEIAKSFLDFLSREPDKGQNYLLAGGDAAICAFRNYSVANFRDAESIARGRKIDTMTPALRTHAESYSKLVFGRVLWAEEPPAAKAEITTPTSKLPARGPSKTARSVFFEMVAAVAASEKISRADAVKKVAAENPGLHRVMLVEANPHVAADKIKTRAHV